MTYGASQMGSETLDGGGADHTPVPPTDMTIAQTLQSLKETQHRTLLLQAKGRAVQRQQCGLQGPMKRLQNQLSHLQDMQRWGSASPGSLDLLLRDPGRWSACSLSASRILSFQL